MLEIWCDLETFLSMFLLQKKLKLMTILLEAKIDDDPLHDQGVKSLLMLLQKTIYKDMRCVLQSGSFRNLTENKTLPQVILTFLY